jgi:hypothetical protein
MCWEESFKSKADSENCVRGTKLGEGFGDRLRSPAGPGQTPGGGGGGGGWGFMEAKSSWIWWVFSHGIIEVFEEFFSNIK